MLPFHIESCFDEDRLRFYRFGHPVKQKTPCPSRTPFSRAATAGLAQGQRRWNIRLRTHRKEHARRVPKDPAFLSGSPQFLEARRRTDLPKLFPEVRNRAEAHLIQMLQDPTVLRRSPGGFHFSDKRL